MRLTHAMLMIAAAAVAARGVARARGAGMRPASGATGLPGRDEASPNAAERLAAQGLVDNGIRSPAASPAADGDLFGSDSQRGPYAQTTGLPDFSRGA